MIDSRWECQQNDSEDEAIVDYFSDQTCGLRTILHYSNSLQVQ